MSLTFYKYQGTGNDFILIDDRQGLFNLSNAQIEQLCHRRFGIGADGLMLLQNAEGYDFRMVYFNSDGRQSSMCGNGGRCITAFARQLGIAPNTPNQYYFIAIDGPHEAQILPDGQVSLRMQDVDLQNIALRPDETYTLNTGSPHYVAFVPQLADCDIARQGATIRYSREFAQHGINVNFAQIAAADRLLLATYERGVEAPTYSCGTGATAAALAFYLQSDAPSPIQLQTDGGPLFVSFARHADRFTDIYLQGPATFVFSGQIN